MSATPVNLPVDLEDARIDALPENFYYIADFITEEEEELLISNVQATLRH